MKLVEQYKILTEEIFDIFNWGGRYNTKSIDNMINMEVYKNPKIQEMKYFSNGNRGLITKNGDLYLFTGSRDFIHIDIVEYLGNKGIISYLSPTDTLGHRQMYKIIDEFLLVEVFNKEIYIGESYPVSPSSFYSDYYDEMKDIIEKCKSKNPHIKFNQESIRSTW